MRQIIYMICDCYVWPMYLDSCTPGTEYEGRCGRCGKGARKLSHLINTKQEALAVFFEIHERWPAPFK